MARKTTPTFVVELPLATTPRDEARLEKGLFEAAKRVNNALIQDGNAIVEAIRNDPAWALARKMPQKTKEQRAARGQAFQSVRLAHQFTDYAFQARAIQHKNDGGFADRLATHLTQKLGTKVFKAFDEFLLGLRGRPRFKGRHRPLHSIEGKNNATGIRWNEDDGCAYLGATWAIPAVLPDLRKDEWLWTALQNPVKYCRIVRRMVRGKPHYFLQLVMEGLAPMKVSVLARMAEVGTQAGIDIGPSNIAWCSETDAGVFRFCAEIDVPKKQMRVLQRQADRQRRANNPDNFDEKGRAKRGCKWVKSQRQARTEATLASLHGNMAARRANAHGRDINNLLGKARTFRHDGVSVKSLQKNYGKSIGARAPGRFMSELKRKAERAGGKSQSINVRQLKTSQYDHSTDEFRKKTLSERWHIFGDGRGRVQRDVYSAFLALHVVETVDADGVITESHDRQLLEAAWVALAPALLGRELFIENESVSTGERPSVGHSRGLCQLPSCEVEGSGSRPGVRTRGTARVRNVSGRAGLNRSSAKSLGAPVPPGTLVL